MIFSQELLQNCENLCNYFEKTLKYGVSRLSRSIVLYGMDAKLNYKLALEIARALNCSNDMSVDCDCLNCRWIRENQHPAVKTYSNLENKTKSDESKNKIVVAQIAQLRDELVISSDYKRVYILCGAVEEKNENGENIIVCAPLTPQILEQESSNAFLKSIEEPPKDTYFIFITRDKNDLLPTILSRSQSFYVHSKEEQLPEITGLEDAFKNYPCQNYSDAKEFIDSLSQWQVHNKLDMQTVVKYVQNYLKNILKENLDNKFVTNTITSDIMKFEDARKKSQAKYKDGIIWENLTYTIYKD